MKSLKRSLFSSIIALVLCVSMLLGTTLAWFTDSVISSDNKIVAGNLDVEMYWSDTYLDADASGWQNADGVPVFTYDKWEPGYSEIKYIKVKNAGNLSLKWRLSIVAQGTVGELSDVIDVYFINPVNGTVAALENETSTGKLTDVLKNNLYTSGVLLPEGVTDTGYTTEETVLAIAFHMDDEAGNEYKGKSIGDGFALRLLATQFNYENDSFGNGYDENAKWPENVIVGANTASVNVTAAPDGTLASLSTMASKNGSVNASVPAGVLLAQNTDRLTLTVKDVAKSDANITLDKTEASLSIDVHIDGVSPDNTVPIAVGVKELLPVGLNLGNFRLYHVENGATVAMTRIEYDSEIAHNTFKYDPATGDVTLYLKSFSEVALVADTENAWEGKFDYTWYDDSKTELTIANADQLAAFSAIVGGMNGQAQDDFSGKIVKLLADINLGDKESENNEDIIFYPIGYYNSTGSYEKISGVSVTSSVSSFEGTFDGNGNTIANFYQNTWEMFGDYNDGYSGTPNHYKDAMGLFGYVLNGTVKNLTVNNFSSDGEFTPTGVIAAYADGNSTFENIAITNCNPRVYNTGNGGIIGIAGDTSAANDDHITLKNITVDNSNKISALWGSWDVACGGLVGMYRGNVDGNGNATGDTISFENCHVSAIIDVYNDVCANYQYYAYRYSGMIIGSVRHNTKNAEGKTIPNMTGISAEGCTVNYGDWNDYYYCEFEKNTMASYSPDYQFSRVPHSELKFTDSNGNGVVDADERASVTGCKHTHTAEENHQAIYLPFHQLFTGYSWGVSSIGLKEYSGIVTDLGITEGDQEESVEKFEKADNAPETYRPGQTITVGDLFKEIAGIKVPVVSSSVYVSVSPVTENDKGSAIYTAGTNDWSNGTITFANDCVGALKIVITDYFFCTKTVIVLNAETAHEKFTAQTVDAQNAYTQITLGDLFTAVGIKQDVTATVLVDGNAFATINGTAADWASKTIDLKKDGKYTVTIKENDDYCEATTVEFTVNKVDKFESKFTGDFLYRVGNANTVAWSSLFADLSNTIAPQNLNVTVVTVKGDAAGTFAEGAIKFTGTGVVKVTISADGANSVELQLEVVDGYNVTTYSELKEQNSVLLADITMSSGGTYRLTGNKVLYGNGFKFDVKNGAYAGVQYDYMSYVIYLENSRLDNVIIEGAVYPDIGGTKDKDYNRAIVMTNGDCRITNSFISNGASPIRNGGNLELVNTTLKGGIYANLDLRNGHLILDNVITINQIGSNDQYIDANGTSKEIVGMGIVVYQEGGSEELKITIKNGLTQYNYLSKDQANEHFTDTYRTAVKNVVFGSDFEAYQNDGWINFGIASMNSYLTEDDLVDERTDKSGYFGTAKKVTAIGNSRDCYVYSFKPATTKAPTVPNYATSGQGTIAPDISFDFTDKNYQPKVEGSNDYCYADGKTVYISMDEGDTFSWDTSILAANKCGNELNYTVTVDGNDYTGKSVAFNQSGTHTVVYSYMDTHNYTLENGEVVEFEKSYTETITIEVSVVKAEAKHAQFSFGANGTAYSAKVITIGDKTYVMPDVTATVSGKIGSKTVNGTTVYYPITEMYTSDGKTAHTGSWYACFPIFKDALQIVDYADKGTGDPVTYNQTKVTTVAQIPSTLKAVDPKTAFLYSMNATNYPPPTDPTAVSGAVCYTCNRNGLTASNTRKEENTVAEYTYTDNAGKVYYFYIGYHCSEQTKGSGGCVTPDTLVTLADGTQKRIDQVTYDDQLLVWNFYTGKYDVASASIVMNHGYDEYTVVTLAFDDGTVVNTINGHGFFDVVTNQFVILNKDNAVDYIGHEFVKVDGDAYKTVRLVDCSIKTEYTESWSILTAEHYNCIMENMFTLTPAEVEGSPAYLMPFAIDGMKYDEVKMQADIEKYGLYTYADFASYMTEEQFVALGLAEWKISVAKGYITWNDILTLISIHLG